MIWRVDCERESAIKVDYIKNAVISMLNFTGSNVALSYQYMDCKTLYPNL
jgi:hypothetical protein